MLRCTSLAICASLRGREHPAASNAAITSGVKYRIPPFFILRPCGLPEWVRSPPRTRRQRFVVRAESALNHLTSSSHPSCGANRENYNSLRSKHAGATLRHSDTPRTAGSLSFGGTKSWAGPQTYSAGSSRTAWVAELRSRRQIHRKQGGISPTLRWKPGTTTKARSYRHGLSCRTPAVLCTLCR